MQKLYILYVETLKEVARVRDLWDKNFFFVKKVNLEPLINKAAVKLQMLNILMHFVQMSISGHI